MFLYYLSLYRLIRFVLVIISISCHYDPFTNLFLYIQYDMLSFTVCLYAICGMTILWSVYLLFMSSRFSFCRGSLSLKSTGYIPYLNTMFTMLRIDFGCTYVSYCWTSRDDEVIHPPHFYFYRIFPVITSKLFYPVYYLFTASRPAGCLLYTLYMFYWYDRLVTFLETYLSLWGGVWRSYAGLSIPYSPP